MTKDRDVDEIRIRKDGGFYGITLPVMFVVPGSAAATAANLTAPFFIANRSYSVVSITARWETAASQGVLQLRKVPSGTAPASGTALLVTGIDLTASANTNVSDTLVQTVTGAIKDTTLVAGNALCVTSSLTPTSLAGLTISVLLKAV